MLSNKFFPRTRRQHDAGVFNCYLIFWRTDVIEITNTLRRVETGEYNGIGNKLVTLGEEVNLPDGVTRPERDSGMGWISKYLARTALTTAQELSLNLSSPIENGKIIDRRMLAWLLIGRDESYELGSERFVFSAEDLVTRALQATAQIAQTKILQGGKRSATNWRSMFEGLVKADIFGGDFQPTIITSLGGYDGKVPLASPFNIVPGLELAQILREQGYDPSLVVTSAAKFGVDCNGLSLDGASKNWETTFRAYQALTGEFYPEFEYNTSFETLLPSGIDTYPIELIEAARICCEADESLRQTAKQYGAGPEAFVRYMLSHTQAFRDFQSKPENPFVIKVGAPSELRFSRWQKQVIEQTLPVLNVNGFVPNMVLSSGSDNQYGQTSLYYPRIGNRPPYYPDANSDEPVVYGSYPSDYQDFLRSIPEDNPSLKRYADLETALEATRIKPNDYLELFTGDNQ